MGIKFILSQNQARKCLGLRRVGTIWAGVDSKASGLMSLSFRCGWVGFGIVACLLHRLKCLNTRRLADYIAVVSNLERCAQGPGSSGRHTLTE